ncbi:MAG: ATP-grasp domain-containing protein [Patescibacteria group bacterium]
MKFKLLVNNDESQNKHLHQARILIADRKNSEIGAEVPYLFKTAGCIVDVFCSNGSWLLKNSFWDYYICTEELSDIEYIKLLKSNLESDKYDWFVAADDTTLRIINECSAEDAELLIKPIINVENRMILGSKAGLDSLCQKYDILTPASYLFDSFKDLDKIYEQIPFPMLLKVDQSSGGKGVFLCHSKREVEDRLTKLSVKEKKNLLFQTYIFGENISVEALFRNGLLLAYTYSIVSKTTNGEFSASYERKYVECPEVESILKKMGKCFGLNGFSSITFMRDGKSRAHYLIESDLRPQVWFKPAKHIGVDFSLAISNYLLQKTDLIRPTLPKDSGVQVMCYFPRSILFAIFHFDMLEILKWICNIQGRWKYIPLYDPRLFVSVIESIIKTTIYRMYFFVKRRVFCSAKKI